VKERLYGSTYDITFTSLFLLSYAAVVQFLNSLVNRPFCTLNCILLLGNETAADMYIIYIDNTDCE
jgi:hypothetical protein